MHRLSKILLMLAFPASLLSQTDNFFTENQGEFLAQLKSLMTAEKQSELDQVYQAFEASFGAAAYTQEEFLLMVRTANTMREQRLSVSPYLKAYLQAVMAAKQSDDPAARFAELHRLLEAMLADPNRKANDVSGFLDFVGPFFLDKKIRSSRLGVNWFTLNPKYTMRYESGQPMVVFEKLTIRAVRITDSIEIQDAAGIFYPLQQRFTGTKGMVSWERRGLDASVYATLMAYDIDVTKGLYEAPKASLHYPLFLGPQIISGKFSDKLTSADDDTPGSYPRFESEKVVPQINNLGKGLSFSARFKLQGPTVYGFGSRTEPARLLINNEENLLLFSGTATQFTIKKEEMISAERVQAAIFIGKDSLFHPAVNIRYIIPQRQLQLTRGLASNERMPFFSSRHNISIDVDKVNAYFEQDSILLGERNIANSFKKEVRLESLHFFKKADYQRIQNIASKNPLAVMKSVAERDGRLVPADVLAAAIDPTFNRDNIQTLLFDLVAQGFITYHLDDGMVEIKDKVFLYVNADAGKSDYDLLRITSAYEQGANARINLCNGEMLVQGVDNLELSSRQRVGVKPDSNLLTLKEDRNMDFSGRLFAGYGLLEGSGFHFDYRKFLVFLDTVKYFDLYVPSGELDENRKPIAYGIASRIEKLRGALLIDAPANKSGKDNIAMFPSLESKGNSFIYYDLPHIQDTVYRRDSFYFELSPFSFQHMDVIAPKDLVFKGSLFSASIFPPIQESVYLQPDRSLGFITNTPETGLPVYRNKGRFTGAIDLSHKGLLGKGNLLYLGASVNTNDIIFRPSELLAKADLFTLAEQRDRNPEIPEALGKDVRLQWRPFKDSMYVSSETAPFALFKANQHQLAGTLILTPGGLKADGQLSWDKASLSSKLIAFGAFSARADTSTINIRALGADGVAIRTQNVNSQIDFDRQIAQFKANTPGEWTYLPLNQYQSSLNAYSWDMKKENINFSAAGLAGIFKSTHPDKDSLSFTAQKAAYELVGNELKLEGVPFIVSADAFIYPDSGLVTVEPGGEMRSLANARIVADTLNKNHVINRATVQIQGRRSYQASGYYEYNIGSREQEIFFQQIVGQPVGKGKLSEKAVETRATGEVSPEMNFFIDHKTSFKGTIALNAASKALKFDGYAWLDADKLPYPEWFSISSESDKNNLIVRYDAPKNEIGDPLYTGLFLGKESGRVYPRVLQVLELRKDRPIFPVRGYFKYDKQKDHFIFADSLRMFDDDKMMGNLLTFNNKDGSLSASGRFYLGSGLKYIKVDAAGIGSAFFPPPPVDTDVMLDDAPAPVEEKPMRAELMTGISIPLPDALAKLMIADFKSSFSSANITILTELDFYRRATAQIFPDDKDTRDAISGYSAGYLVPPKRSNNYTFLFSKLKLKWDTEYQSFINTDPNTGLVSIAGENLDQMVTGYVEFRMPGNEDDRLYVYVKAPSGNFYFFGYKQGILNVTSDNEAFMGALSGMKTKDLTLKMPDGENFEIQPLDENEALRFVRRIQAAKK